MNPKLLGQQFPQLSWDELSQSWVVPADKLIEIVTFLKDSPSFKMDYVSNLTGVDWLPAKEKVKNPDGTEKETEKHGYLEVVYHFFSIEKKHGPVILRCRTNGRESQSLPSITPLFRGAEFQEREIYDLYGIRFTGHPDLRRILMWDEFQDFPMRKDYQEPDDYEWEPTPHDDVLTKANKHFE